MTIVKIKLRSDSPALDGNGDAITDSKGRVQFVAAQYEQVDLDVLSPRARALAEAIAVSPTATAAEVWMESDEPIRERMPDWEFWYSEEQASKPERRPWRGWDKYRATDKIDPHAWLERQAAKIPAGWHVLGATPHQRVETIETGMTAEQVLAYLKDCGRHISPSTWRAYVARGQAPAPVRKVGRTPLWAVADVRAFAER